MVTKESCELSKYRVDCQYEGQQGTKSMTTGSQRTNLNSFSEMVIGKDWL